VHAELETVVSANSKLGRKRAARVSPDLRQGRVRPGRTQKRKEDTGAARHSLSTCAFSFLCGHPHPPERCLSYGQPAVHVEHDALEVAGLLARQKQHRRATSSGMPTRPAGMVGTLLAPAYRHREPKALSANGERVVPGAKPLTATPWGPYSAAHARVSWANAALVAP
jgi:hypothetical protein